MKTDDSLEQNSNEQSAHLMPLFDSFRHSCRLVGLLYVLNIPHCVFLLNRENPINEDGQKYDESTFAILLEGYKRQEVERGIFVLL